MATVSIASWQAQLAGVSARWLVTGGAGFIGSNLVEALLRHGQYVRAVDNFSTGHRRNLAEVREAVGSDAARRLEFIEADILDLNACRRMVTGIDYVLHQAALGSVPRSLEYPVATLDANVGGFGRLVTAAKDAKVRHFVYASSSSVYGDHPGLPKVEAVVGKVLSPYAATKAIDELLAEVYTRSYGIACTGLRYFNIFGRRQDPNGAYAAVIPRWIASLLRGEQVVINGDGKTSRDFCYVDNAVQANVLAALRDGGQPSHRVFNVAFGQQTTLLELFRLLKETLVHFDSRIGPAQPIHGEPRAGDVRHSLADISRAAEQLHYRPTHSLGDGLRASIGWYVDRFAPRTPIP